MPKLDLPKVGDRSDTGWAAKFLTAFGVLNGDLDGRLAPDKVAMRRQDYVTPRDFNAVNDGQADDTAPLQAMAEWAAANNKAVKIEGRIRGSLDLTNVPVNIIGDGAEWVHAPGTIPIRAKHTLLGGPRGQVVNGIGSLILEGGGFSESGEDAKWQAYNTLTVADSVLRNLTPNQGDWLKTTSDDAYAGDYLGTGKSTWVSEPSQVAGIAMRAALTGGSVAADDVVTGATSGATAYVASNRKEYGETVATNRLLMLNNVKGVFLDGEPLMQGGVQRGTVTSKVVAVALMMYPEGLKTNVRVHKYRDIPFRVLGVTFVASDDVDSDQPGASRAPAMELTTIAGADIDVHVASSWRQGVRAYSCVAGRARIKIDKLPGYAEDIRAAWGYGFEAYAATCYWSISLDFHNGRHGFSTNINATSIAPSQQSDEAVEYRYAVAGVAAKIDVTGTFYNCTDAAMDTHGGSMYIRFHDFYVSGSMSGGRSQARPTGIQNRSFATVIENGVIEDVVVGIRDISTYFASPFPALRAITHMRDIVMRRILQFGVEAVEDGSTDESKGYARHVMTNLDITFRRVPNLTGALAPNKQAGLRFRTGRIEANNVTVRGTNDAYASFEGGPTGMKEVIIRGGLNDIADSPNQAYNIRIKGGDIPVLVVENLKCRVGAWSVPSILRIANPMPATTFRTDGCGALDTSDSMAAQSGDGAVSSVVRLRGGSVTLRGSANWDVPTLANGAATSLTIDLAGASLGDYATAAPTSALSGVTPSAYVSASGKVTVVLTNNTGSAKSLGTIGMRVRVEK
ncbi:hypothetical protein SAMN04487848_2047 [Microbacterium sp. ru370.1]|uniref:hypothetical protein n=1 Tax=unclassified Microbacterium TaxID=2609290 RepID=UPI00089240B1|nr:MULTISPECIES: hypothetical protein [unclassified Microbacterium]SDO77506.1 hypothetical protein SAMN04487848_2047 [Microbacterium sp. ru370.1]SIT88877.1 hypothetical protein SAMN05880579_2042 [Microbacterium sp. RU1D]